MRKLLKKLVSLISLKNEKKTPKIKVCWDFLAKILGDIVFLTDKEKNELGELNDHNPDVLREIIREYVVSYYRFFTPENQEKIKNSLTYYLATNSFRLKRVFPSYHVPIDDTVAKLFYTIVWQELYGTDFPEPINPDDYEEDCSDQYIMSLIISGVLEEKYNPDGKKPSIDNIKARLEKQP